MCSCIKDFTNSYTSLNILHNYTPYGVLMIYTHTHTLNTGLSWTSLLNIDLICPLSLFIPGALDFVGNLSGIIGLIYVSSTIYQLIRYLAFVIIILLMKFLFKTKFYRHTKVGIVLSFFGFALICYSTVKIDLTSYQDWPGYFISLYIPQK